ncbi:enoyl-CoA hydratase-related protein [Streptomyces sp. NPDC001941]|uniref:enoyl-CoA hydratase-related protein n=1 Tax=Streptomyces sp. NPDC001941 TaxID=3154659 RepID=UPI00332E53AF
MGLVNIHRYDRVALVTLNRPEALNALSTALLDELLARTHPLDRDPAIGCLVITGSDRAFSAGADIKEMADKTYEQVVAEDYFGGWDEFAALRTPKIAAVAGHALGGGCELALLCDTVFAADNARFGQPEVTIGAIPGIGGTQRLTRAVGKAKAMDLVLTGRTMDAAEAERCGLVSRVLPPDRLLPEALEAARAIASYSDPVVATAREMVEYAQEAPLAAGVRYERRAFHELFRLPDREEGMRAYVEKRAPRYERG